MDQDKPTPTRFQRSRAWLQRELGRALNMRAGQPRTELVICIKAALEAVEPKAELDAASAGEEALRLE